MFSSSIFEGNLHDLSSQEAQRAPIGIFDSGVGGLTVLRQLYEQLPNESIIYLGDTARLPYGIRSQAEIIQFTREIIFWMENQGVKMVIMACSTSSALALEAVRSEFKVPILGLILPGAVSAVKAGKRIGVIATPATAKSNAYKLAIEEINSNAKVWQVGCPEFVPLIEQNRINDPYTKEVALSYLEPLLQQDIDVLVYGCTHYPHLATLLRSLLGESVKLVDPGKSVVEACARELDLLGLRNTHPALPTRFTVSGSPQKFAQSSLQWLGFTPMVELVNLENISLNDVQQDTGGIISY
ncbi:MAG: glutamate racemase [Cyanobacteria bacterium P01_D01_bin.50]